jgi:tetraacyldisaccharide 4'-kinase
LRAPAFWWRKPGLAAHALAPLGALYGAFAARRMRRRGARAPLPVICVGDPTLGGGGKTPTVVALVRLLREGGEQPFVISRGYGGTLAGPVRVDVARSNAAEVGDEPMLLAAHAPTIVARDRVAAARLAAEQGASALLLDDGFQNPSLEKDLSFLVMDGEGGVGNGRVFPAGPLRAPYDAQLPRAQAVIVVGGGEPGDGIALAALSSGLVALTARIVPDPAAAQRLAGRRVLAFAGIARPAKFHATLAALGAQVVARRDFADHHRYSASDARALLAEARTESLELVTTEKDRVRMQGDAALQELAAAAIVLPVRLEFADPESVRKLLRQALQAARR